MTNSGNSNLPPLQELLAQIKFPVYGLRSPYLGLKLRSLHYGIEEENDDFIGLGLFYAQKYLGSPQVIGAESSLLPEGVTQKTPEEAIQWSWSNLVGIQEALDRLHRTEPAEFLDEDILEQKFQASIDALRGLQWARLAQNTAFPLLTGMDVSRGHGGEIMARRFEGRHMLLVVSVNLQPEEFLESLKQLVTLQDAPKAIQRHQDEFERMTQA
jgi:hypothetical protein